MFAVIYRGFIKPEKEQAYKQAWEAVVTYFIEHCGAIGSTLHKTAVGEYVAYSRWPTRETRDAVWGDKAKPLPADIEKTINAMKSYIDMDKPYDEIELDIINDLLLKKDSVTHA